MIRHVCLALLFASLTGVRSQPAPAPSPVVPPSPLACGDEFVPGDTTGGPSDPVTFNPRQVWQIQIPTGTSGMFISSCPNQTRTIDQFDLQQTEELDNYQARLSLYADPELTDLQCESDFPLQDEGQCAFFTGELRVVVADLVPPSDGTYYYLSVTMWFPTVANYQLSVECSEEDLCLDEPVIANSPWEMGECTSYYGVPTLLDNPEMDKEAVNGKPKRNVKSLSKEARKLYSQAKKEGAVLPYPELQSTQVPFSQCCAGSLHEETCRRFFCYFGFVQVGDDPLCRDGTWITPTCDAGDSCTTEPVIPNANPTNCNNTDSGTQCADPVTCLPGFQRWGSQPWCINGDWISVPRCVTPGSGYGHLWFTTLDQAVFAYHKPRTLRLWASPANDMELQVRTLAPSGITCTATLIGMLALRAGDQTVSVIGSEDSMDIYFNGVLQNLVDGSETLLGSGPDLLSVSFSAAANNLQISSKRGALFNVIFYFQDGMSWLTVPHTLDPAAFYGNTMGMLGVYDGNPSNDFTLRNGTVLPHVVVTDDDNGVQTEFGDSWVVDPSEYLFSALEDNIAALDPEYQFPTGMVVAPPYIECPVDFSNYSIPECEALAPELVTPCKFDVVIGGPQFLDDIEYQQPCGSNDDQYCSYHGVCEPNGAFCECFDGWGGADCSGRVCPDACLDAPGGGSCEEVTGLCECAEGFTGPTCEFVADCSALDDCNAADSQGICIDDGVCQCEPGFVQPNCDVAVVCPEDDDNLEVQYPPELDETNTEVIFDGNGTAEFLVTIIVPNQYNTANISFESASDSSGGFDSESGLASPYWTADTTSDPCNTIYTGLLPWSEFRRTLGGVEETFTPSSTSYSTVIVVEATRPVVVTPETKLLQVPDQTFTRKVTLRVPFEITFQTLLYLSDSVIIRSNNLRVEPALLETSIVEILDDGSPDLARAVFEIVTVIPLPLRLDSTPTISTGNPDLDHALSIQLRAQDCDVDNAFCTQYWTVELRPRQCTLNGIYSVRWTGVCHDLRNCVDPVPNFTEVDFDITSDSFCGVFQEISLSGILELDPVTSCNGRLFGFVHVTNDHGAQLNKTEIVQVIAHPPLENPYIFGDPRFVEVYAEGLPPAFPLDFQIEDELPDEVIFSFLWLGSQLRCDVEASVHIVVRVEYQATRDLGLLEMPPNSDKKSVKAGETFNQMMLLEFDDQTLRMTGQSAIGADPAAPNGGPTGGEPTTLVAGVSNAVVIGAGIGVLALIVILITVGVVVIRKVKKNAEKEIEAAAAEAAVASSPQESELAHL